MGCVPIFLRQKRNYDYNTNNIKGKALLEKNAISFSILPHKFSWFTPPKIAILLPLKNTHLDSYSSNKLLIIITKNKKQSTSHTSFFIFNS